MSLIVVGNRVNHRFLCRDPGEYTRTNNPRVRVALIVDAFICLSLPVHLYLYLRSMGQIAVMPEV